MQRRIFAYIDDHAESEQKIFFDGQIYDAFELLISLVRKAIKKIVLIDGYVDIGTLNILAKKNPGVDVIKHMTALHDCFLILEDKAGYHVGASLKDAGKKCFGIRQIQDEQTIQDILNRL